MHRAGGREESLRDSCSVIPAQAGICFYYIIYLARFCPATKAGREKGAGAMPLDPVHLNQF